MELRSVKNADLAGKRVILRVDFNVTIIKNKLEETYKVSRCLPTIDYLLKKNCRIVILSHIGRPAGKRVKSLSLKPVFNYLRGLYKGKKISFCFLPDKVGGKLVKSVLKRREQIIMLENLRFEKGEDINDARLAKVLAKMGDIFVNEAFALTHRFNASAVAITKLLPSFAGLNLLDEVHYLEHSLKPKKPGMAMIGGAKIETKLPIIKNFQKSYDKILVGGGIANTLLKAKKYDVGGSLIDAEEIGKAKTLINSKKLLLPVDLVVANKETRKNVHVVKVGKDKILCAANEQILDIGPKTIYLFSQYIKKAATIVWNGPMGLIEIPRFSHGSVALARIMAAQSSGRAVGIAGGGETLLAIHKSKMEKYFDFISTGGGAMLEFLGGKKLPGVEALKI